MTASALHDPGNWTPAIQTIGLTKQFGDRLAVDAVNLMVPRGVVYGLLGHNGAGKTTLIRMVLGLTHRAAGDVRLLGLPVPERQAYALARVGALIEEPKFHPQLTGRENLRIIADARGLEARARIGPALERVGLTNRADDRVKEYSLGMRQRLGVARALLADPELLILDEPTNGLDPAGIVEFRQLIRSFAEDEGRTVFLSSHQLSEVEKVCDGAAIIDRGRVLEQGAIDELAGGRGQELTIGCDDPARAVAVLDGRVARPRQSNGILRVTLEGDPRPTAAAVNSRLVQAGVQVWHLQLERPTLEQRFLQITSTLGAAT
jgi:ABC-2 type transport system ATP-binding protein